MLNFGGVALNSCGSWVEVVAPKLAEMMVFFVEQGPPQCSIHICMEISLQLAFAGQS